MTKWSEIITYPSAFIIIGRRGSGKTGLGCYLLEKLSRDYSIEACYMGLPEQKAHLLPNNITPIFDLDDMKDRSITFIDEASMKIHARAFRTPTNILMDKLLAISRQKRQIIIFASHHTRKLDVNIITDIDGFIFKEPSELHIVFERKEIKNYTEVAFDEFEKLSGDKRKYSYVISRSFKGMMKNPLASFWSENLSFAFSGVPVGITKDPVTKMIKKKSSVQSDKGLPDGVFGNIEKIVKYAEEERRRCELYESLYNEKRGA